MCNRVGQEDKLTFAGESLVIAPDGNVVVKADASEQIVRAEIDLKDSIKSRQNRPYIKIRRPGFYK